MWSLCCYVGVRSGVFPSAVSGFFCVCMCVILSNVGGCVVIRYCSVLTFIGGATAKLEVAVGAVDIVVIKFSVD